FSATWGTKEASEHPERLVSSGMWILEAYYPKEQVVYRRNPHFFMVDEKNQRLPYLDKMVVRFVKDMNNQALQFEQGKLDTYAIPGKLVSHTRLLKGDFTIYDLGPNTGTTFLTFNLNPRKDP